MIKVFYIILSIVSGVLATLYLNDAYGALADPKTYKYVYHIGGSNSFFLHKDLNVFIGYHAFIGLGCLACGIAFLVGPKKTMKIIGKVFSLFLAFIFMSALLLILIDTSSHS